MYLTRTNTGAQSAQTLLDRNSNTAGVDGDIIDIEITGTATEATIALADESGTIMSLSAVNPSGTIRKKIDSADILRNHVTGKLTMTTSSVTHSVTGTIIMKVWIRQSPR